MSKKKDELNSEFEADLTATGPVRQRRSVRVKATRSRTTPRRKLNTTGRKLSKVGGIHQRANKRVDW
jgi:hypothetical protein